MNSYRIKKERERLLLSSFFVVGSVALIMLISFLFNIFKFEDFTDYSGPVKVTFGSPDSLIEDTLSDKIIPEEPELEPEVPKEEIIEPVVEPEPIVDDIPKEIIDKVEDIIPEPVNEPVVEKKEVVEKRPVTPPEPVIQKGRESGNSHETSFESSSSKIGRRAYFPIIDYMPLPKVIDESLYSLIKGDITGMGEVNYNRSIIDRFYWKSGNSYTLIDSVPFQNRPDVWAILKDAGYDMDNPEYKKNKNLKPVVIIFEINSNSNGRNSIKSTSIESSSGDSLIDEAVLYGFKQSTYSNSTNENVKGRFKYSFNNP